jgi:hypothetical protein
MSLEVVTQRQVDLRYSIVKEPRGVSARGVCSYIHGGVARIFACSRKARDGISRRSGQSNENIFHEPDFAPRNVAPIRAGRGNLLLRDGKTRQLQGDRADMVAEATTPVEARGCARVRLAFF